MNPSRFRIGLADHGMQHHVILDALVGRRMPSLSRSARDLSEGKGVGSKEGGGTIPFSAARSRCGHVVWRSKKPSESSLGPVRMEVRRGSGLKFAEQKVETDRFCSLPVQS